MVRLGLVLCSGPDNPLPSTRIALLNLLPGLQAAGYESRFLFSPVTPTETPDLTGVAERALESRCDVVIFQKVHGPSALMTANRLREAGVATLFLVCDLVVPAMVEATDASAVVTGFLRSLHPGRLQHKISVIHDGIERPEAQKRDWHPVHGPGSKLVRATLVTSAHLSALPVLQSPPSWLEVTIVGRYRRGIEELRSIRWESAGSSAIQKWELLKFLANPRVRRVPWTAEGAYTELMGADIGIIPVDTSQPATLPSGIPSWRVKSENRLTMKMAIGLPVIATPIPAYEDVIEQGVNGFLANSAADWRKCLSILRSPEERQRIGLAGRESVRVRFSSARQAELLVNLMATVLEHNARATRHSPNATDASRR